MWSKPVKISDRAMDPLGMNRVSDRITNEMLAGITTMTSRARYFSFYTWAIYDISQRTDVAKYGQFERAFYDRERAFMMACIAHQEKTKNPNLDHSSILGSTKGQAIWNESKENIKMTFSFLANRLGGYGYYYQASLASLGLTNQENVKDTVTELGKRIALSFQRAIENTEYFKASIGKDQLPQKVLEEYGDACCLCKLPKSALDRNPLREILFGLNKEACGNTFNKRRRESLSLILYIINEASKHSLELESENFLNAMYFRQMIKNSHVINLAFPHSFDDVITRWRMFRAHDYFSYACESFLCALLKMLEINSQSGLTFEQFLKEIDNKNSIDCLSKFLGTQFTANSLKEITLIEVINGIGSNTLGTPIHLVDAEKSQKFDSACNLNSKLSEFSIVKKLEQGFNQEVFDLQTTSILSSLLLLFLYLRFYHYGKEVDKHWTWLLDHTLHDLSPSRFLFDLGQKLKKNNFTLFEFLNWLIDSYVIQQAQEIYNEKALSAVFSRPISWFHKEGVSYVKDRGYYPRHRNSRFSSCHTILKDLGLSEYNGQYTRLTHAGLDLLKKLGIEVQ
jgi:hypothetical protein